MVELLLSNGLSNNRRLIDHACCRYTMWSHERICPKEHAKGVRESVRKFCCPPTRLVHRCSVEGVSLDDMIEGVLSRHLDDLEPRFSCIAQPVASATRSDTTGAEAIILYERGDLDFIAYFLGLAEGMA